MSLSHFTAAPLVVVIRAESYLIRPLTLGDFGAILANAPPREDGSEPSFGDSTTTEWMFGDGLPYLLYASIRQDRPDFTLVDAAGMAAGVDAEMVRAIYSGAMRRLPSATPDDGKGVDIKDANWGLLFKKLATEYGFDPRSVALLTLDQVYALILSDEDHERSTIPGEPMTREQVEAWYREQVASGDLPEPEAEPIVKIHEPAEVTLESLGLEIVPEDEERPTGEST